MTRYTLVKDKLHRIFNYYIKKARECKDLIEFFSLLGWFIVETSEVISKSDLSHKDKETLVFWVKDEMTVLRMIYIRF